jgi:glutaredoxin
MKVNKVKLYSTVTCPYCIMEKNWLDNQKIIHEVIYVDQDQNAAREMIQSTGQMGVPVTEITYDSGKKELIVGFDRFLLNKILIEDQK